MVDILQEGFPAIPSPDEHRYTFDSPDAMRDYLRDLIRELNRQFNFQKTDADNMSAAVAAAFVSPLTTKGDLLGYNTAAARIPVGTNGYFLVADSTQALGVKYQAPPSTPVQSVVTATNDVTLSPTGSYSLIDDMTLTYTSTGRSAFMFHSATYRGAATDTANIVGLHLDGTAFAEGTVYYYGPQHLFIASIQTPSSGSRTITAKIKTSSPAATTVYQDGSSVRRIIGVCELG